MHFKTVTNLGIGTILITALIISSAGYYLAKTVSKDLNAVAESDIPALQTLSTINKEWTKTQRLFQRYSQRDVITHADVIEPIKKITALVASHISTNQSTTHLLSQATEILALIEAYIQNDKINDKAQSTETSYNLTIQKFSQIRSILHESYSLSKYMQDNLPYRKISRYLSRGESAIQRYNLRDRIFFKDILESIDLNDRNLNVLSETIKRPGSSETGFSRDKLLLSLIEAFDVYRNALFIFRDEESLDVGGMSRSEVLASVAHSEKVLADCLSELSNLYYQDILTTQQRNLGRNNFSRQLFTYSAVVAFALSLFISYKFKKTLKARIDILVAGAQNISSGNLLYRIPVRERDELGMLGDSFNQMSEMLLINKNETTETINQLATAATVFMSMNDAVMIFDSEKNCISVNKALTEITGFTMDEFTSHSPGGVGLILRDENDIDNFWRTIEAKERWRGEIVFRKKSEDSFPSWGTISVVRNELQEITKYVFVFSDITSIKETQERLNHLAHHDPLTNLPNRRLFNERFQHAIVTAKRNNLHLALLLLDLDHFKNINDSLGHAAGDLVLKETSLKLQKIIRETDTIARLGGDEFVILTESVPNLQSVVVIVNKIREELRLPINVSGYELSLETSIGISLYPSDADNVQDLMRCADIAMYQVKASGRSGYKFYPTGMSDQTLDLLLLEGDLRKALKKEQFYLLYQPLIDLKNKTIIGMEALIRWQHPKKGSISPIEFISLAEEMGLIIPIGEWVLRTACNNIIELQNYCNIFLKVSVNISPKQIRQIDFIDKVENILTDSQLNPQSLVLEITEDSLIENIDDVIETLSELKALGVRLAIDDFGTGYSSLSYLKKFPIDTLKIDRSFVKDIPNDEDDMAITTSITALGRSMHLEVVAEGVETIEQENFLSSQSVDFAQGYLYSAPITLTELRRLLKPSDNSLPNSLSH